MMISRRYLMSSYKGLTAILKKFAGNMEAAIKNIADLIEPVATVKMFAGKTPPLWHLFCMGQLVNIADYPGLYEELGGAASPWNTGTVPAGQFRIPDLRECSPVGAGKQSSNPDGWDYYRNKQRVYDGTERDPATGTNGTQAHDAYLVGEFHDDQMQNHTHLPNGLTGGRIHNGRAFGQAECEDGITEHDTGYVSAGRTGTTTHGKRVGVYFIIKY